MGAEVKMNKTSIIRGAIAKHERGEKRAEMLVRDCENIELTKFFEWFHGESLDIHLRVVNVDGDYGKRLDVELIKGDKVEVVRTMRELVERCR